jgi:hypothetical protein
LEGSVPQVEAFYALIGFKGGQKAYPNKKGTPELTGKLPAAD